MDTSIWIDLLRQNNEVLSQLLLQAQVAMHPMIIGELACGHLQSRATLIRLWQNLPKAKEASHQEALFCLEQHRLFGKGIGFVDLHLLASTLLTPGTVLWTNDRRLKAIADDLKLAFVVH